MGDARMFSYGPLVRKEDETEGKQDVEMAESGVEGQRQKRCGGRKWNELRPLFLRTGLVSQATGSSFFEAERTKIVCSVFGPMPLQGSKAEVVDRAKISCDIRFAKFSRRGNQSSDLMRRTEEEEEASATIARAVETIVQTERYPKTGIEINLLVLEDGGSAIAAALTCACLAVADAGIEMSDLMAGCSVVKVGDEFFLDPTAEEERLSTGEVTVSYTASQATISSVVQTGQFDFESVDEAIRLSISGGSQVTKLMRSCLVKREQKRRKEAARRAGKTVEVE